MQNVNKVPIWFMRQAGRYLPEYMAIRKKEKNFLNLCLNPSLAAEISLQPIKRFDVDFIILFCDILVIPFCLGQKVSFLKNHGPILDPIFNKEDIKFNKPEENLKKISNVFKTIELLSRKKGNKNLIGFCGGAFTILNYMIEGGTSEKHEKIRNFVRTKKIQALELIEIITEISVEYLKKQIVHGVDYVQIFESWAGLLEGEEYEEFIIKPNKVISTKIKKFSPATKIIHFPRGSKEKYLDFINEVYCDVISIDQTCPDAIMEIAKRKDVTIQGDLEPKYLLGDKEKLLNKTIQILEKYKYNKHIFNLSHGIIPTTPIENVEMIIKTVKNYETT